MIFKSDIDGRIRTIWPFGIIEVSIMLRHRITLIKGWGSGLVNEL
jgi:hypothetical protein